MYDQDNNPSIKMQNASIVTKYSKWYFKNKTRSTIMAELSLNEKTLQRHLRYLQRLNRRSKNQVISSLRDDAIPSASSTRINSLFGAWEDERSSDQINAEIRTSRVKHTDRVNFDDLSA